LEVGIYLELGMWLPQVDQATPFKDKGSVSLPLLRPIYRRISGIEGLSCDWLIFWSKYVSQRPFSP
jgi:hypothetical protein